MSPLATDCTECTGSYGTSDIYTSDRQISATYDVYLYAFLVNIVRMYSAVMSMVPSIPSREALIVNLGVTDTIIELHLL